MSKFHAPTPLSFSAENVVVNESNHTSEWTQKMEKIPSYNNGLTVCMLVKTDFEFQQYNGNWTAFKPFWKNLPRSLSAIRS